MPTRRTRLAVMLCAWASCLGLTLATVPAGHAATPRAARVAEPEGLSAPVALPEDVDDYAPYQPQRSCSPRAMRGVAMLRDLVLATYQHGRDGGIIRPCTQGGTSEHKEGRSWDWSLAPDDAEDTAAAQNLLGWLLAPAADGTPGLNARRLGVMYVIYDRRIWSSYRASEGWRSYSGDPHVDHVHLSFSWSGARGRTSFWTGEVGATDVGRCVRFAGQPAPLTGARFRACPDAVPLVARTSFGLEQFGSTNATVLQPVQQRLGVPVTGNLNLATWRAVKRYQRRNELFVTGVLDQPTWASLNPGDVTSSVLTGHTPASAAAHGDETWGGTRLRRGAAGEPVAFLQLALGLPAWHRSGVFRTRTARAVRAFKVAHGLPDNPVVTPQVWTALAGGVSG